MLSYNACHREGANATVGSDGSAAGGGGSDLSEWQRSAADAAAVSARKMPGTATGFLSFISKVFCSLRLPRAHAPSQ